MTTAEVGTGFRLSAPRPGQTGVAPPQAVRASIPWPLDLLLLACLFVSTSAVFPLLAQSDDGSLDPSDAAALRWLLLPALIAAPLLLLARAKAILSQLRAHPALPLLLLWIWASAAWSVAPEITVRRALALTSNTLIACYLAVSLPASAIITRLLWVLGVAIGISLLFAVALPDLAFMPEIGGALRGAFTHKNGLGIALVLAASLAAVAMRTGILAPPLGLLVLIVVMALLVPTGSSTALMLLMLLLVLQLPVAVAKLPPRAAARSLMLLGIATLATAAPLLIGRNRIFMALGRDPTLTGRTELWALVQNLIGLRPLQGYGYQAMFARQDFQEQVLAIVGWPAPNSHNGYLELWLGTGFIGLVLALAFLLPGLLAALHRLISRPRSVAANFACVLLPIYLFRNFSEANLVAHQDITWIIAVLAVLCVSREARPGHHARVTAPGT